MHTKVTLNHNLKKKQKKNPFSFIFSRHRFIVAIKAIVSPDDLTVPEHDHEMNIEQERLIDVESAPGMVEQTWQLNNMTLWYTVQRFYQYHPLQYRPNTKSRTRTVSDKMNLICVKFSYLLVRV